VELPLYLIVNVIANNGFSAGQADDTRVSNQMQKLKAEG